MSLSIEIGSNSRIEHHTAWVIRDDLSRCISFLALRPMCRPYLL